MLYFGTDENDPRRMKTIKMARCTRCYMIKRLLRGRQIGQCRKCWGRDYERFDVVGVLENCLGCGRVVVIEWGIFEAWKQHRTCVECGGIPGIPEASPGVKK